LSNLQAAVVKYREASKSAKGRAAAKAPVSKDPRNAEELRHVIAPAAYYLAERRNFEPRHELEDWLDAEAEVMAGIESLKGFPA
jgi:hypothetical protein